MTIDNMPLASTQTPAECGVDALTIDDTREATNRNERASVAVKRSGGYERVQNDWLPMDETALHRAFGGDVG